MSGCAPIGVFDSGYGGLTVFKKIREMLPDYDFIYLGDNARAPYGTRSFDVVHEFTWQAVKKLFTEGCPLVILACNTASAKALRTIQQNDLPCGDDLHRRVLGVIRPTTEIVGTLSTTGHVGILGTAGTVSSHSYAVEIAKFFPNVEVTEEACPMWVPLVENMEMDTPAADYFVERHVSRMFARDPKIDVVVLACTHYPLLIEKIRKYVPAGVKIFMQGNRVAECLKDYLLRHQEMDSLLSKNGTVRFLTTESAARFEMSATAFLSYSVSAEQCVLV